MSSDFDGRQLTGSHECIRLTCGDVEHVRRVGDPNRGGSSTRVPMMTAYRQQALRCAGLLAQNGPMRLAAMRAAADVPNAAVILQQDVYGWFDRVERGVYAVTPAGKRGLELFGWAPSVAVL